jgi:hypothetical protein
VSKEPSSQYFNTNSLLLDSTTLELLFLLLTELEEFFSATEELDFLESFWEDEEAEPLSSLLLDEISPIGSGTELLDSSPQATNKTAENNNAAKYFTEDLLEPKNSKKFPNREL